MNKNKNIVAHIFNILVLGSVVIFSCNRTATRSIDNTQGPSGVLLYEDREVSWQKQQLYHAFETAVSRMTDGFLPVDVGLDSQSILSAASSEEARTIYESLIDDLFLTPEYDEKMRQYYRKLLMVGKDETEFIKFRRAELALYVHHNDLSIDELFTIEGSVDSVNFSSLASYDPADYASDPQIVSITPTSKQSGVLTDPDLIRILHQSGTSIHAIRSNMQYLTCQQPPYTIPGLNKWKLESISDAFHAQPTCESCHSYLQVLQGTVREYDKDGFNNALDPLNTWGKLSDTEPVLMDGIAVGLSERDSHYTLFSNSPVLTLPDFVASILNNARDDVDRCWSRRSAAIALSVSTETSGQSFAQEYAFDGDVTELAYLDKFQQLFIDQDRSMNKTLKACLKYDWCFIAPAIEPFTENP